MESGETIIADVDGCVFCASVRLQYKIADDAPQATILIASDGLGNVVGIIRNVECSPHKDIIAQAHKIRRSGFYSQRRLADDGELGWLDYGREWLGRRDSNPDTQLQRLQSYR